METTTPQKSSRSYGVPIVLAVVLLCLSIGSAFVWWYLKSAGGDVTIKLSQADLNAIQKVDHDPPMTGVGPNLAVPRRRQVRPAPVGAGLPDGVFPSGDGFVIRAGQVLVRVTAGDTPTLIFRERAWGLLQDRPVFTIARRIVHEAPLAQQLAISADQMKALKDVVAAPPVAGKYLAALPVNDKNMQLVTALWLSFIKLRTSTDTASKDRARSNLLKTTQVVGASALTQARGEYDEAAAKIRDIVTPRQIEAYRAGTSLTAP
jgi:hypothetical protein